MRKHLRSRKNLRVLESERLDCSINRVVTRAAQKRHAGAPCYPPMHARRLGRMRGALRYVGTIIGLALIVWAFRNVSLEKTFGLLSEIHAGIWLIPLPFALAQMTETFAWKTAFGQLKCSVPYLALLRVRLACEGITQTCPGGMLIAESIKPGLLMSQCGLTASDAVCGTASRKFLILVAHCGYFALAALLGIPALLALSHASSAGRLLSGGVATAWLVLALSALGLGLVLGRGDLCKRVHSLLGRLPIKSLRSAASNWKPGFLQTDRRIAEFCSLGPRSLAKATLLYLLAWCFETVETLVLFSLLGVHLDIGTICLIEVSASMIRQIAFLSPAGLGAQDLGYAGLLQIFGVPDALGVAAAFLLLKRGKELLWSLVGYSLLMRMGKQARPSGETVQPSFQPPIDMRKDMGWIG